MTREENVLLALLDMKEICLNQHYCDDCEFGGKDAYCVLKGEQMAGYPHEWDEQAILAKIDELRAKEWKVRSKKCWRV